MVDHVFSVVVCMSIDSSGRDLIDRVIDVGCHSIPLGAITANFDESGSSTTQHHTTMATDHNQHFKGFDGR